MARILTAAFSTIRRRRLALAWVCAVFAIGALFTHVQISTLIRRRLSFDVDALASPFPSAVDAAMDGSWRPSNVAEFNEHYISVLESCASGGICHPNANKLVILAWGHFSKVLNGDVQGENVWCEAVIDALHALGYSMIFSKSLDELQELNRRYRDELHLILWSNAIYPGEGGTCLNNATCAHLDPDTFLPPNATHSILPAWKIFAMHWWGDIQHPLGANWTLSPENYRIWPRNAGRDNFYLGYSLEKSCTKTAYIPHSDRPRQAYVFAKRLSYFLEKTEYILPEKDAADQPRTDFFANLASESNVTFLGNFAHDAPGPIPAGIVEMPGLNRSAFQGVTARSRVVLGIGSPPLSPTPWEVLCLGVPFINPVLYWDVAQPDDRSRWSAQQSAVLHSGLGEPYVYHVKTGDREGFERAVKTAMETPIPRYIPPQMRMAAFLKRVQALAETDWASVARRQVLEAAKSPKLVKRAALTC